jgi:hypothetical protein
MYLDKAQNRDEGVPACLASCPRLRPAASKRPQICCNYRVGGGRGSRGKCIATQSGKQAGVDPIR